MPRYRPDEDDEDEIRERDEERFTVWLFRRMLGDTPEGDRAVAAYGLDDSAARGRRRQTLHTEIRRRS